MTHQIVFTLGKTQPPHAAHYAMLADALLTAGDAGKLIHFIGSTNVPTSLPASLLNFEERQAMLKRGLEAELKARYQKNPNSIPQKFHARIHQTSFLTEDEFSCIALPDFSHPDKQFTNEGVGTPAAPAIHVFNEAKDRVVSDQLGLEPYAETEGQRKGKFKLTDAFQNELNTIVSENRRTKNETWGMSTTHTLYSQTYIGWAINLKKELDQAVLAYAQMNKLVVPDIKVVYEVCGKDAGTQQYIDLTAGVIRFLKSDYHFDLNLTDVKMLDEKLSISATFIREAIMAMLVQNKPEAFILSAEAENIYPVLKHVSLADRQDIYAAALKLKAKVNDWDTKFGSALTNTSATTVTALSAANSNSNSNSNNSNNNVTSTTNNQTNTL